VNGIDPPAVIPQSLVDLGSVPQQLKVNHHELASCRVPERSSSSGAGALA
jgi:hypothetical protein